MHTLLKLPLLLLLVLCAPPAWGSDESFSDYLAQRWAGLFSDHDPQAQSKQAAPPLYQTSLTTTSFSPPVASSRLRDLAPETDQARTQGLLSSTTWLNGLFVTETEVAQNQGGTGWVQSRIPGDTPGNASQRMIRLGLTGAAGSIRYGLLSRSAGQAFLNGPDQARREVWGEWTSGWTTLRSTIGQQWNNVTEDSTRSRLEQTYGRVGIAWKRPIWPEITLTYAHNSLNSTLEPLGVAPQRNHSHTLESAVAYNGTDWNARLASSYILGSDLLRGGTEYTVRMQTFTATFRPSNTLTIAPTLGYRDEVQGWSGVRTDSPSASVALQYRQNQQILLSAMGNYAGTRSSDGLIHTMHVGGKGRLAWDVHRSQTWTTLISLEAGYNRMTNHVSPATGTEDISGVLRLVLAAL
ncbi:MAG TPA: hypothetical protein VK901_10620 [Nitrospiraceae bacterium]|nr:hypothetical protein [Nitrospiraceae bacterium]